MKYMGSKQRIAKYIVPILQQFIDDNNIDCYYEPFVGGANIIDKVRCKKKIGSDANKYLIALLNHVRDGGCLYEDVSREFYNSVREAYKHNNDRHFEDWQIGNVGFLASFSGRWFDGGYAQASYENTKGGRRFRDYYQEAKRNIEQQRKSLLSCEFYCMDYRELHPKDSLIYCDPPYQGTKQYANAKEFDYAVFYNTVREWAQNNIVVVSEMQAPDDFCCIWEQKVSRSINAMNKSSAVEKLFIYNQGVM